MRLVVDLEDGERCLVSFDQHKLNGDKKDVGMLIEELRSKFGLDTGPALVLFKGTPRNAWEKHELLELVQSIDRDLHENAEVYLFRKETYIRLNKFMHGEDHFKNIVKASAPISFKSHVKTPLSKALEQAKGVENRGD